MERIDVTFSSSGIDCAAWLYRPRQDAPVPLVVMAHGFSATRELRLDAYAERFCAAGLGVLLFDYRHFGASGGEPRQLLDIGRQHADYHAAIAHARAIDWVEAKLSCPALFCVGDTDSVAPAQATVKLVSQAPRGEIRRYALGHFDIYVGEAFEQAVADQTEFLVREVLR